MPDSWMPSLDDQTYAVLVEQDNTRQIFELPVSSQIKSIYLKKLQKKQRLSGVPPVSVPGSIEPRPILYETGDCIKTLFGVQFSTYTFFLNSFCFLFSIATILLLYGAGAFRFLIVLKMLLLKCVSQVYAWQSAL